MTMIDRGVYASPVRRDPPFAPIDARPYHARRGKSVLLIAVGVLAALVGVIWSTYNQGIREGGREAPPRIAALPESYRLALDEPGRRRAEPPEVRVFDVTGLRGAESSDTETDEEGGDPAASHEAIADWEVVEPHGADAMIDAAGAVVPRLKPLPPEPPAEAASPLGPRTLADASDANRRYFARREPVFVPDAAEGAVTPAQAAAPSPSEAAAPPEVVAPPPVVRAPAPPPSAAGPFLVQVASFRSRDAADLGWREFSDAFADLLEGFAPDVVQADLGDRGVRYRLRVGLFADRAAASEFCDAVKQRGRECLVVGA